MSRTRSLFNGSGRLLIGSGVIVFLLLAVVVLTMVTPKSPDFSVFDRVLGIAAGVVQAVGFMWVQARVVRHGGQAHSARLALGTGGYCFGWGIVVLGVISLWFMHSWALFGTSITLALLLVPGGWGQVATLVVLLLGLADMFLVHPSATSIALLLLITIAVTINLYALTRLASTLIEVRSSQEEIARLRIDAERHRISRDLHDIIGRTLVATSMRQQAALHLVDRDPVRAKEQLNAAHDAITDGQKQLRSIIQAEMNTSLPDEITDARSLCDRLRIRFDLTDEGHPPEPFDSAAAQVLREAITNMLKHSTANACQVTITPTDMSITNNGCSALRSSDGGHGTGIAHLRSQIEDLGGSLVASHPSRSTFQLRCTFPAPQSSNIRPSNLQSSNIATVTG
ncbi:sensor histidine kinase [Cutibacterium sp. WCA-380-WT-3A]|uniref:Sensor histidine kinase n=1 Tax=Cutibacterium porci TaxID=2605781 RepID=A0A7K0J3X8_9ACTN|nr:histidine kinase [Cutibacterium porci]MSS44624.1 sensor histidine kinase [Cutibacterium porci]